MDKNKIIKIAGIVVLIAVLIVTVIVYNTDKGKYVEYYKFYRYVEKRKS